jgi:hypothetical protein
LLLPVILDISRMETIVKLAGKLIYTIYTIIII